MVEDRNSKCSNKNLEGETSDVRKPNLFIIGAPKCGTTSLAAWLAEHPNVYMSPLKEPHFFNVDGRVRTLTIEDYEALFEAATDEHLAIGEASTHYLYSHKAVSRILDYNPKTRFIVCLRNPVEMAPALHGERLVQGVEVTASFENAWRLQEERRRGRHIPMTIRMDPERLQYGAYCKLGAQMERLLQQVPRDRVLPLLLDDIIESPKKEWQRVLRFIGLEDDGRDEFPVLNAARQSRSILLSYTMRILGDLKRHLGIHRRFGIFRLVKNRNVSSKNRPLISKSMQNELGRFFDSDIMLLGKILDRDLSNWVKEP